MYKDRSSMVAAQRLLGDGTEELFNCRIVSDLRDEKTLGTGFSTV